VSHIYANKLIWQTHGINIAINWDLFGLEGSYMGIISGYSGRFPGIIKLWFLDV
jgi:hypothetical protein